VAQINARLLLIYSDISFWQWFFLALGSFSVGLSKTGVPGIGILNVAIFALVLPSRNSVGVVLPILIAADIVAVTAYNRHAVWSHLWRLFPWAAGGVVLGYFAMGQINDKQVAQLIGAILLALVILTLWRKWSQRNVEEEVANASPLFTGAMGIAGGFTTLVANAAGPIMTLYLLAMRLPKMEFLGTGAWYFLILNCFKVPFMMQLQLVNAPSLLLSAKLAPFAICGALFGRAIIKYINQEWFEKTAIAFTVIAALRLLFM
jgi:hypothetical protein